MRGAVWTWLGAIPLVVKIGDKSERAPCAGIVRRQPRHACDEQWFRLAALPKSGKRDTQMHSHFCGQVLALPHVLSLIPLVEDGQLPAQDQLGVGGATESEEGHGVGVVGGQRDQVALAEALCALDRSCGREPFGVPEASQIRPDGSQFGL